MPEPPAGIEVVVFGASGFLGSAVCDALERRGAKVLRERTPRLPARVADHKARDEDVEAVARILPAGVTVINAAGLSDSGAADLGALLAANACVPALLAAASNRSGGRFIHVSSAAVQGRAKRLDSDQRTAPFSAYSRAKAAGERAALAANPRTVCYRPPGVHAPDRSVTRAIAKLARSPLSSTAAPGTANTAQALVENVADACAFLALCVDQPPGVVTHPSEQLSTSELLRLLGGREPRLVPQTTARAGIALASLAGRMNSRVAANARRLEILWLGQEQADSWLSSAGWSPVAGRERWREIGRALAGQNEDEENR